MDKKSELDCFFYFMWNEWSKEVCIEIFGENLGNHYWSKYERFLSESVSGAPAIMYGVMDASKRRKIVDRAIKHYNG